MCEDARWKNIKDERPKKTGRRYLVANICRDDKADMIIAEYYHSGDKVFLHYNAMHKPESKYKKPYDKADQKAVIVQDEGFYIIVPCERDQRIAECYDELVCVARTDGENYFKETFWSDLPLPPAGTRHPYEVEDECEREAEEDLKKKSSGFCESNNRFAESYRSNINQYDIIDTVRGNVLEKDEDAVREAVTLSALCAEIGLKLHKEYSEEELKEARKDRQTKQEFKHRILEIAQEVWNESGQDGNVPSQLQEKMVWLVTWAFLDLRPDVYIYNDLQILAETTMFDSWYKRIEDKIPAEVYRKVIADIIWSTREKLNRLVYCVEVGRPEGAIDIEFWRVVKKVLVMTTRIVAPAGSI